MVKIITQDSRNNAGSSICGSNHNLTTSRIFFIEGHSLSRNPIITSMSRNQTLASFCDKGVLNTLSMPVDIKAAPQSSIF